MRQKGHGGDGVIYRHAFVSICTVPRSLTGYAEEVPEIGCRRRRMEKPQGWADWEAVVQREGNRTEPLRSRNIRQRLDENIMGNATASGVTCEHSEALS